MIVLLSMISIIKPEVNMNAEYYLKCLSARLSLDFEYLWSIYQKQNGNCAITGMPMTHNPDDLCAVSVGRIDSSKKYVPGNIRLVCKWIIFGKQEHSDEEFKSMLDEYYRFRRDRDAGLDKVNFSTIYK